MADEKKIESVEIPAGNSKEDLIKAGSSANKIGEGKPKQSDTQNVNLEDYVPKKTYEELQSKLTEQGSETGELREFAKSVSPLIEKLKDNEVLVEAIMGDKITVELAQAVIDGKVTVGEAEAVSEAHKEVKEELGKKEYGEASKEDVEKLVAEKLKEIDDKFGKKVTELESNMEGKEIEQKTTEFINNCPDYLEYADLVADYFKEHTNEWDVEKAYYIVKGKELTQKATKENDKNAAEAAKEMAANAAGGGSQTSGKINDKSVADELIATMKSSNAF